MVIYKITNNITKNIYIGQTIKDVKKRFNDHCSLGSKCPKISSSIQKHGRENFTIEVIERCNSIEELSKREEYWIKELNSIENGYNLTAGGDRVVFTDEVKRKMSLSHKGKKLSKEHKASISLANSGRSLSVNQIIGIKKTTKDQWKNENTRKKLHNAILNKNKKEFNVYIAMVSGKNKTYSCSKGKFVGTWQNQSTCYRDLNIKQQDISDCLLKKRLQSKGYIFEYIEGEGQ